MSRVNTSAIEAIRAANRASRRKRSGRSATPDTQGPPRPDRQDGTASAPEAAGLDSVLSDTPPSPGSAPSQRDRINLGFTAPPGPDNTNRPGVNARGNRTGLNADTIDDLANVLIQGDDTASVLPDGSFIQLTPAEIARREAAKGQRAREFAAEIEARGGPRNANEQQVLARYGSRSVANVAAEGQGAATAERDRLRSLAQQGVSNPLGLAGDGRRAAINDPRGGVAVTPGGDELDQAFEDDFRTQGDAINRANEDRRAGVTSAVDRLGQGVTQAEESGEDLLSVADAGAESVLADFEKQVKSITTQLTNRSQAFQAEVIAGVGRDVQTQFSRIDRDPLLTQAQKVQLKAQIKEQGDRQAAQIVSQAQRENEQLLAQTRTTLAQTGASLGTSLQQQRLSSRIQAKADTAAAIQAAANGDFSRAQLLGIPDRTNSRFDSMVTLYLAKEGLKR